jgi:hypothetical protein
MKASKACDITGIVAIACARHGCFAPNSIVDLFRGEQQKNVDWALLEAIRTTGVDPAQGILLFYDIVCQYIIYLMERIGHLLPPGLEIDRGIGLFHVHDHKEVCFFRYASTFIPGAGVVAGEILESLWAGLNKISPAARTATLAHRAEMIDDHAADSNFKKTIGIGKNSLSDPGAGAGIDIFSAAAISDRFIQAREMARQANDYYHKMSSTISQTFLNTWEAAIQSAERHRVSDPSVMDMLGAQDVDPIAEPEPRRERGSGQAQQWLQLAIAIEERQYVRLLSHLYGMF